MIPRNETLRTVANLLDERGIRYTVEEPRFYPGVERICVNGGPTLHAVGRKVLIRGIVTVTGAIMAICDSCGDGETTWR